VVTATLVGLLVPVILVFVGVAVLFALLSTIGVLLGLLWPALPIVIGLALLWRVFRGSRR